MIKVWCGFPGIGKTYLSKNSDILDTDSSSYSKDFNFPRNYVDEIEKNMQQRTVFVSTHEEVRRELFDRGIPFGVIFPAEGCKAEYLKRFIDRDNGRDFIIDMVKNFDHYRLGLAEDPRPQKKIVLEPGQFLTSVINSTFT